MKRRAEAGREVGLEAMRRRFVEFFEGDALVAPGGLDEVIAFVGKFKPAAAQVAIVDARAFAQLDGERRVHARAVGAKLVVRRFRSFGIARRQNAGAGPGSLLAEVAPVEQRNLRAFFREEVRGRQTNHAAAEDQDVGRIGHADVIFAGAGWRTCWRR